MDPLFPKLPDNARTTPVEPHVGNHKKCKLWLATVPQLRDVRLALLSEVRRGRAHRPEMIATLVHDLMRREREALMYRIIEHLNQ
jgi:hypothetical protein